MSVSAHDVAAELRQRFDRDPGVTKIHKLLYYAQGWHLTWVGEPLFRESIEAWTNGPVVADVWHDEKRNRPRPAPQGLAGAELATVDYVMDRYGAFPARELIRRTTRRIPGATPARRTPTGGGP